jgi:hypothetical protein
MTDRENARRFFASLPRLVSVSAALAGRGDALTIDDATRGAADAAMLAREFGHDVSLFVNPEVVLSGGPYWFNVMDLLVDAAPLGAHDFDDSTVTVDSDVQRRALRERIKTQARLLRSEQARLEFVQSLADRWRVEYEIPRHYQVLQMGDLIQLRNAGVELQNHGWSHCDHTLLSADESNDEIRRGRDWLKQELDVDGQHFAVPYGDVMPRGPFDACESWLTFFWEQPGGLVAPRVFNRVDLPPDTPDESTRRREGRLASVVRRLRGK